MNRLLAALAVGTLTACSGPAQGDGDTSSPLDAITPTDATALDEDGSSIDTGQRLDGPSQDIATDNPAPDVPVARPATIVFQCAGLAGGICTMNADGTNRVTVRADGRAPDRNASGEILFHDDSYAVHLRRASGTDTTLGAGAFARWSPDGTIVFQCSGLGGGLCDMAADGSTRRTLASAGRVPDRNTTGDIVYHDDAYVVHVRHPDGTDSSLGSGANAEWSPGGHIAFQCEGLAGGLCDMNADGTGRMTLRAAGRSPDRTASGVLYHDDSYVLHRIAADGSDVSFGPGAFGRWSR
jgi:hypothetical protein